MASGLLGRTQLSASAYSIVYTVPASRVSTFNVSINNHSSSSPIKIRVAMEGSSTATPNFQSFIEYDAQIAADGVLERTGLVLGAGQTLMAWVDTTSAASCVVYGFEESA